MPADAPPASPPSILSESQQKTFIDIAIQAGAKAKAVHISQIATGFKKAFSGFKPKQWGVKTYPELVEAMRPTGLLEFSENPKNQEVLVRVL